MRNFLNAESYYIRRDTMFRGICLLFLIASTVLAFWVGTKTGFEINNLAEPLTMLTPLSLFLYFIIPIYVCFFTTEGFEYGSIKIILAAGQSRFTYITGKYLSILIVIIWWIIQFFGLFYILYMSAAIISGSNIGNQHLRMDLINAFRVIGLNVLYLATYSALIMMVGIMIKRTASAVVATFLIIFGDFMISGYFREASSAWLRMVSDHTLTTQIMKFSGIYVVNSQHVVLAGTRSFVEVIVIPIIIITICLAVTYISFGKRDIHA
ncbi:ABC transporter permease [Paenibacillus sp. FA6]|uniref:ABC transporter permease n=1 Tax=Paenibacillus sp. FA6 TaxID=3413029 RepID=UPI003F660A31